MKKYLLVCLLGLGTMLPSNPVMSSIVAHVRILSITIEGWVLSASSDESSGAIHDIQVYNLSTGLLVRSQACGGYSCSVSLEGLPSGNYVAYVVCANTVGSKKFKL